MGFSELWVVEISRGRRNRRVLVREPTDRKTSLRTFVLKKSALLFDAQGTSYSDMIRIPAAETVGQRANLVLNVQFRGKEREQAGHA